MEELIQYFTSGKFYGSLILVLLFLIFWKLISSIFIRIKKMDRFASVSAKKKKYMQNIYRTIRTILLILFVLMILQVNGIDISSLLTGLGVTSIVVAFALQDVLKDVLMGVDMVADNFYSVGDVIRFAMPDGSVMTAKVIAFNLKDTKLQDIYTNSITTICNRNISAAEVVSDWLDVNAIFPYEISVSRMEDVMEQIKAEVLRLPDASAASLKGIDALADSAILYKIRIFCPPAAHPQTKRDVLKIILEVFEKNSISVPYNQLVIHQAADHATLL